MRMEQVMGLVLAVMGVALVLLSRRLVEEHAPAHSAARERPGAAGVWSDRALAFHLWRGRIAGGVFALVGLLLLTGVLFGDRGP